MTPGMEVKQETSSNTTHEISPLAVNLFYREIRTLWGGKVNVTSLLAIKILLKGKV